RIARIKTKGISSVLALNPWNPWNPRRMFSRCAKPEPQEEGNMCALQFIHTFINRADSLDIVAERTFCARPSRGVMQGVCEDGPSLCPDSFRDQSASKLSLIRRASCNRETSRLHAR